MVTVLGINGSPHGDSGNCAKLADVVRRILGARARFETIHLADEIPFWEVSESIGRADGFVFLTGTYWDSWGSPLQRFLEEATVTEGTDLWLGKPCVVGVLMHSVGGKGVLSRLQGVLNTYGLFIPPMSGFLYSVVNQLALKGEESPLSEDLWRIDDLEVVCHNLLEACRYPGDWRGWPVNRTGFDKVWLEG
jgi:chromate reductase